MKRISSNYIGVTWNKHSKTWQAHIKINGQLRRLGLFKNEHDAHLAYQKTFRILTEIENY